jgi:hypothetical protein
MDNFGYITKNKPIIYAISSIEFKSLKWLKHVWFDLIKKKSSWFNILYGQIKNINIIISEKMS